MPADTAALRSALRDLHRELLAAQRVDAERITGRMTSGEVLQAAIDDLRFDWLRTLSETMGALDAAAAEGDEEGVDASLATLRALVAPPDDQTAFGTRYLRALQHHPGVVLAHRDVTRHLG
jgi:hypothetical protein